MMVRFSASRAALMALGLLVSAATPVRGPLAVMSRAAQAQEAEADIVDEEAVDEGMVDDGPVAASPETQALRRAASSGVAAKVRAELAKNPDVLKGNSALAQQFFLQALNSGQRDIAAIFLANGADVNARYRNDATPLEEMLSNGNTESVAWLLENKADVNAVSRSGQTPIFLALGQAAMLKLFLDKGASLTATNARGQTPLLAAIQGGNAAAVRALLAKGADIKTRTADGQTALHLAARTPSSLLKTLLQAGADAKAVDDRGNTPLHIALRDRSLDILERDEYSDEGGDEEYYEEGDEGEAFDTVARAPGVLDDLIEKSDVSARNAYDQTPLLLALLNRDAEARATILERAPKLDKTSALFDAASQGDAATLQTLLTERPYLAFTRLSNGMTPLHMAALWGSRTATEALLAKGVEVNARDGMGATPLAKALSEGVNARRARALVPILLAKGARTNLAGARGQGVLHLAVKLRDPELLATLIAGKANLAARDRSGKTPLHLAVVSARDMVAPLLAAGANVNARDNSGQTPLFLAAGSGGENQTVVAALLAKGADVNARTSSGATPLANAMNSGAYDAQGKILIRSLVDAGADVSVRDRDYGESPLMRAMGNKELFPILLSAKKLDINARDESGQTLLMRAAQAGNADAIRALLAKGADATLKNSAGETALQIAQKRKDKAALDALQGIAK